MIKYKNEYKDFIVQEGVGKNDKVASSPNSYISYLNCVSELLNLDISPDLVQNEGAIDEIFQKLDKQRAKHTLSNYKTALNQYLKFCLEIKIIREKKEW